MTTLRRTAVVVTLSLCVALLMLPTWGGAVATLLARSTIVGLSALAAYALFEGWPTTLPRWLTRWALQVVSVAACVPLTTVLIYVQSTPEGGGPFWANPARMNGWTHLTIAGLFVAPWSALIAVVRQKEAFARHRELTFALERSELERQALDARLTSLQAQVAPHFLFNTLANVQALIDAGSPQASAVLRSLTAYLRAAVPLLHEPTSTIERELELVRPYLELMQMRMPDRLQAAIHVDPGALRVRCPQTTVMTLVENAVRHGIDPSEEGGRIDVAITKRAERCVVRVADTGTGLQQSGNGLGTGLTTLRERLQLIFGEAARLHLRPNGGGGTIAEIDMPADIA